MDILDMPNTNKYSFEGWDISFHFTPLSQVAWREFTLNIFFHKIHSAQFFGSYVFFLLKNQGN